MEYVEKMNEEVWCRLAPSPLHGIGVFAIRDIPAGTTLFFAAADGYAIGHYGLDILHPAVRSLVLDRHPFDTMSAVQIVHHPNRDARLQAFMNHSRTPNTDGHVALEDIQEGEELTENYRKLMYPLTEEARDHFAHFL